MGMKAYPAAVAVREKLRERGLAVELPAEEMKFKKSLGLADKLGARYALILGEDEVASGTYTLKRLADAQQQKLERGRGWSISNPNGSNSLATRRGKSCLILSEA
jgi:histidyl-tRNA synthetase